VRFQWKTPKTTILLCVADGRQAKCGWKTRSGVTLARKFIRINSERAFPRRGDRFGMASRPGAALLAIIGRIKL
jgi:hypothetical protein